MMSTASLVVVVLVHLLSSNVVRGLTDSSLPYGLLYPFGADVGDRVMTAGDENTVGPLDLGAQVPFGEETYSKVYIHNNGLIPLNSAMVTTFLVNDLYTPRSLPITDDSRFVMLAPFWADVDTFENVGRVYYRIVDETSSDAYLLNTVSADIRQAFRDHSTFTARILFIVTWHNVTFYGGSYFSSVNTFQAVLASDLVSTFVIYNYGQLRWSCGRQSGGNTSGLGGIGAVVGYNTGSAELYAMAEGSLSDRILRLANSSNVGIPGRWSWLVVKRRQPSNSNTELWPSFDNPILSGPVVQQRLWFEFYCDVVTNETDSSSVRFEVQFLFDNQTMSDVPTFTVTPDDKRATLHEKYLNGKLGKSLTCQVRSYWLSTPNKKSEWIVSRGESYYLGIRASTKVIYVAEDDIKAKTVMLKSSLPITCTGVSDTVYSDPCNITLTVTSSDDIVLRQRYPGKKHVECIYIIMEDDWKSDESWAYNTPLEVIAQVDPMITGPRTNQIIFSMPTLADKTINGETYVNPWSNYELEPHILAFHYDSSDAIVSCTSTGDPHVRTFGGFSYSSYSEGTFIYVQTLSGLPMEIQVRQRLCNSNAERNVTCICAIALREDQDMVGIDFCNDTEFPHPITNTPSLPEGSGIFTDNSRQKYKLQMPSGTRVYGTFHTTGLDVPYMDMEVLIVGNRRILEGFCGSPDGNSTNDIKIAGTEIYYDYADLEWGFAGPILPEPVESSYKLDVGQTLFENITRDLGYPYDWNAVSVSTYCQCLADGKRVCGGPAVTKNTFPGEPNITIVASIPSAFISNDSNSGRKRRDTSNSDLSQLNIDDIDTVYNPYTFSAHERNIPRITVTADQIRRANEICWGRLTNITHIGQNCSLEFSQSNEIAQAIVGKCTKDVLLTGATLWADDKISELQQACTLATLTRNYSDIADPLLAIERAQAAAQGVLQHVCSPYDCNGHGICEGGSCVCQSDHIGADCGVSLHDRPSVLQIIDPSTCDISTRPCLTVNVKVINAASVDTLACKIVARYWDGRSEDFIMPANLTTSLTARCALPTQPLLYFNQTLNFSSVHDEGFDFDCVYRGSPVVVYTISMSNDGRLFGSQTQDIRIVDQSCMQCSGSTCRQQDGTCLINGYCFAAGTRHPYLSKCYHCMPTISDSSWTRIPGSADSDCISSTRCSDGEKCVPTSDHNYKCDKKCNCSYSSLPNFHSWSGVVYRGAMSAIDCQRVCSMNLDCLAIDYDSHLTKDQCWLYFDDRYKVIGPAVGVTQYIVDQQHCVRCVAARWQQVVNYRSTGGVQQSNIASLADCLEVCVKNSSQCRAVDYDRNDHCWVHNTTNYVNTRYFERNSYQYIVTGDPCSHCTVSTTKATTSAVTTTTTRTTTCQPQWTEHVDRNSFFAAGQPDLSDLESCKQRCLQTTDCVAIDYTPSATPTRRCWVHTDIDNFQRTQGYWPGTNQYVVERC